MASAHGRPRRGIRVRGHGAPMRKWPVVCGLAQGRGYEKIGQDAGGRTVQTVKATADQLGLAGRPALYDFGIPVSGATFSQIKAASGLSANELAQQTQLPAPRMAEWILSKYSRHRIAPKSARKLIEWRDVTLRRLLADVSKPSQGLDRYSGSSVLKTLSPTLRQRYGLLLDVLRQLRKSLKTNSSWGTTEIQNYLCEQAMLEVAGKSARNLYTKFLPWVPDLMPFMQANIDRLKGRGNLWPLAYEAIAARWGTGPHIVAGAIKPRTNTISPKEMRWLVSKLGTGLRPGPKLSATSERSNFRKGNKVEDAIPIFQKLCADLRNLSRRARTNPQKAMAALQGKGYTNEQIEAGTHSPGDALVAARWFVSIDTRLSYSVVARYHQEYRKLVVNPHQN